MKIYMQEVRKSMSLTQQELATSVGVSRQTINNIEKGRYNPSVELVLKICAKLNCKVEQLFVL